MVANGPFEMALLTRHSYGVCRRFTVSYSMLRFTNGQYRAGCAHRSTKNQPVQLLGSKPGASTDTDANVSSGSAAAVAAIFIMRSLSCMFCIAQCLFVLHLRLLSQYILLDRTLHYWIELRTMYTTHDFPKEGPMCSASMCAFCLIASKVVYTCLSAYLSTIYG